MQFTAIYLSTFKLVVTDFLLLELKLIMHHYCIVIPKREVTRLEHVNQRQKIGEALYDRPVYFQRAICFVLHEISCNNSILLYTMYYVYYGL